MKEIAWAAGLYEGEGTCCASNGGAVVSLTMTDLEPVQWFFETLGCGKIYGPYHNKNPKYKPIYRWFVCGWDNVDYVYKKLQPWLCDRRQKQFEKVLTITHQVVKVISEPCGYDTSKSLRGGYDRHRRRKEPACKTCLIAYNQYMKNYRNKE